MDFTYSTEHVEACWKRWWLVAHLFKEIVEEMACLFVFFLDWYISVVKFQSLLTKKQERLQFHNMPAAGEHQFIGWRSWISVLDIYLNQPCLQAEDMKLLVSYTWNWLILSFNLGGGFKYVLFSPLFGEMIQFP